MTRLVAGVPLVLALALASCAQPQPAPSEGLDPELGVAPSVSPEEPSPAASPTAPDAPAASTPTGDATPAAPGESPAPAQDTSSPAAGADASQSGGGGGPGPRPDLVLISVADAAGDHGREGPGWADLRAVELVEIGNDLRVTLRFDGPLPATPPEGEVPLVGVDIGDGEDGYQLFVEGGGQSWAAYLDTPQGFVAYPGTFELAGAALVLQVPFNAVGSPTRAPVRVFAEWSRDSGVLGALNPTSEDHLDGEPHRFDRSP